MPNWCMNHMRLSHSDPAMMDRALAAWNKGEFLNEFIPVPYELTLVGGARIDITKITNMEHHREMSDMVAALNKKYFNYPSWYEWCCDQWGTKWDIGHRSEHGDRAALESGDLLVSFDSAWAPPIAAYEKLHEMGFEITAYYWEPGMCFCGTWADGVSDHYQNINDADSARRELPHDLDAMMGISENLEEWETA
jgi:hypothetical protein